MAKFAGISSKGLVKSREGVEVISHRGARTDRLMVQVEELAGREDGQGLVEYSLILLLVSVVSIIILTTLGTSISSVFQSVVDAL